MGILQKIKHKLKAKVRDVRALSLLIRDEAKHPGRPQPHMAARNPMWGGEDTPNPKPDSDAPAAPDSDASQESDGDFWYLRGDDEGWSDPNPGQSGQ